ncbi:hypothetical protein Mgrana_02964 [Meiothermus granaticius NBRC 107808]|uniref:Uncharacterized protein n=1 Tax=Meiothermus granaticius NBRC 107808 TaxID=1227551 RepID=A0A399F544_9DEIN|nr:hypothetical protein Mgrana_02964 [Meiothermus granaticius NBRC 107808]
MKPLELDEAPELEEAPIQTRRFDARVPREWTRVIWLGSGARDPDQTKVWSGMDSPRPPLGGDTHSPPSSVE